MAEHPEHRLIRLRVLPVDHPPHERPAPIADRKRHAGVGGLVCILLGGVTEGAADTAGAPVEPVKRAVVPAHAEFGGDRGKVVHARGYIPAGIKLQHLKNFSANKKFSGMAIRCVQGSR